MLASTIRETSTLPDSIKESVEESGSLDVNLISTSSFPFPSTNNSSLSSVSNLPLSVEKDIERDSISLMVPFFV